MSRLIIRAEAEADIAEAARWYEDRLPGLGWDFVLEMRAAIRRAAMTPHSFLRVRKQPEVRRVLTRRFPYRVFFIVRDDAVIVFCVMHAARHERHWRARL